MGKLKQNIVMFPFMANGHIIPSIALALELEKRNSFTITFVNTPLNIKKLKPKIPPNSSIRLLEIPYDGPSHGLPPNSENTDSLPFLLMPLFIETSRSLLPAFRKLISDLVIEGQPPLCIISDMFFGWSARVAHEFGAFHAIFNAGGGYGMAAFHSLWLNLPHRKVDSEVFLIPGFPDGYQIHVKNLPDHLKEVRTDDSWYCFSQLMFKDWMETDGILLNTMEKIDHVGLNYFRQQIGCPVWPIGPIVSSLGSSERAGEGAKFTSELCMKWLDSKPENSVLYVAFGSQSALSPSQSMQLALALEASGKNFIWVVRPSFSSVGASEYADEEWLPGGFEERICESKQGMILTKWAPQLEILSHISVCAFLSHCGWNSVLEALGNGVPILSWPMMAEQHFNAKMLEEEMGVCVGVAIGSCEVKHEDIVKKIEMVMSGTTKGKEMKSKACEVRELLKNAKRNVQGLKGPSAKAMDEFLLAALKKTFLVTN